MFFTPFLQCIFPAKAVKSQRDTMTKITKSFLVLVMCTISCIAQPVERLPVLKEQPAEVLFRVSERLQPAVLECITEGGEKNIKYTWHKNGQPFTVPFDVVQRKDEGSLVFLKPNADDEGLYQCFAESESGIASTRVTNFKRTYLAIPQVKSLEHTPIEGKPFKLECPIPDAYPKPTIVWKSQLGADPSISENILDPRITLSPDGTLWFSNVSRDDVSTRFKYVCLGKSPAVDDEVPLAEHWIKDLSPESKPKDGELTLQYVSNDMMAKAGDVTMIYCIYGGTPLAHPDWYKDGTNVNNNPGDRVTRHNRTSGKRLLIRDTILEDQGSYTCIVNNEVGKPLNHTMYLTVVSSPAFAKKPEKQVLAKEGQDVVIPCQVTGVPAPKVTYTYNGKALAGNDRVSANSDGLTIKNVQKSDKGYYGCRAVNKYGDEYAESLIHVA